MKNYKYRAARLFHITIWGTIIFFSIYLLIECIRIFGLETEIKAESYQETKTTTISTAFNYMIQSNIPILDYVENQNNLKQEGFLLSVARLFPINRYISEVQSDYRIVENDETTMLANANGKPNFSSILPIDIIQGELYSEQGDGYYGGTSPEIDVKEATATFSSEVFSVKQLLDRSFLYNNFYIIDSSTKVDDKLFNAEKMLEKDMTMKLNTEKPQILIYHTHSRETFSDSRPGKEEDTIVGVGEYLAKILTEEYGYNVIHDKTQYDMINGVLDRNLAYNNAEPGISKILEDNPSIEVVIDLHRDGTTYKRVTKINGKPTAQLMFFNGLSTNSKGDEITYLSNDNLQDNLAFSLQLQLKGREKYPGLFVKNYLKAYRYNLHVRPKSLLIETGTDHNTVEEAMNAMELLADVLHDVLAGNS